MQDSSLEIASRRASLVAKGSCARNDLILLSLRGALRFVLDKLRDAAILAFNTCSDLIRASLVL